MLPPQSPQIEAIVISQLDKNDPIATSAAHLLERFGSKDSEPALWARLEKWHRSLQSVRMTRRNPFPVKKTWKRRCYLRF